MSDPTMIPLGAELRDLRKARGLSLTQAAARASIAPATLANWEMGRRVPSGPPLAGLLIALGVEDRQRARLMAASDPTYFRWCPSDSPIGAPVPVGAVLRAMRLRRGMTQQQVAERVGVRQGTVAKWESGDTLPPVESVHAACFALAASPEEVACIGRVQADCTVTDPHTLTVGAEGAPHALQEVMYLGAEAVFWRRSARRPEEDEYLVNMLSRRAHWYLFEGRLDEIAEPLRRAMSLASTGRPAMWRRAIFGLMAQAEVTLMRGGTSPRLCRSLTEVESRLTAHPAEQAWCKSLQARALMQAGETRAGLEAASDSVAIAEDADPVEKVGRVHDLASAHLQADDPERALALVEGLGADGEFHPEGLRVRIGAMRQLGQPVPAAMYEALDAFLTTTPTWLHDRRYRASLLHRENEGRRPGSRRARKSIGIDQRP